MKNNLKLTYTGNVLVSKWGTKLGDDNLEELLSVALLTERDVECKNFTARFTIKIEDLSEPLRIERPDGSEERGVDEYECI